MFLFGFCLGWGGGNPKLKKLKKLQNAYLNRSSMYVCMYFDIIFCDMQKQNFTINNKNNNKNLITEIVVDFT